MNVKRMDGDECTVYEMDGEHAGLLVFDFFAGESVIDEPRCIERVEPIMVTKPQRVKEFGVR